MFRSAGRIVVRIVRFAMEAPRIIRLAWEIARKFPVRSMLLPVAWCQDHSQRRGNDVETFYFHLPCHAGSAVRGGTETSAPGFLIP